VSKKLKNPLPMPKPYDPNPFPEAKRRGKGRGKPEAKQTPTPVLVETPAQRYAREYREGLITDSFGNYITGARDADGMLRQTVKVSALGPSPEIPKPAPVTDASQGPLAQMSAAKYAQDGKVMDAGWHWDQRHKAQQR
jgi:hypothetical protein